MEKETHVCVGFFPSFLSDMFEKALNAGFIQATDYVEIWQAYLDYLRRRVDFTQGMYNMFEYTFVYCHYFGCTELLLKTSIQKNTSFVSLTKTTFSPQLLSIKSTILEQFLAERIDLAVTERP